MPPVDLRKTALKPGSRLAIFGPPNTLKTTAMLTWPKPLAIMVYPGEKGWDTIPKDREDIIPIGWELEDPSKVSPAQIVQEVEKTTWRILAGEFGPIQSFAGDGLHKLYGWYYRKSHLDMTASFSNNPKIEDPVEAARLPAYSRSYDDFGLYLTKLLNSSIPWVVCSMWEGKLKDDPEDTKRGAPQHIFPDLPRQLAHDIVGEFPSGVLYAETSMPDVKGMVKGTWQTRKLGAVWGCGLKVPADIAAKIPAKIAANYDALMAAYKGEGKPA